MANTFVEQSVLDDAAYHLEAPAFSSGYLDPQNAGTHIGIFLAWIILNRLESFSLRLSAAEPLELVRCRQMTGRDFLFAHCEGRLTISALNKRAQAFTRSYYEDQFLRDYTSVLVTSAPGTYFVADNWSNYERIAAVINHRFDGFRITGFSESGPV